MSAEKKELITKEEKPAELSIPSIHSLPDLGEAEVLPIDMMTDYWTPEEKGETKRIFFNEIRDRDVLDKDSGEVFKLTCAYFMEKQEDGSYKTICNGSKRLVGVFEGSDITKYAPFEIVYMGKKSNSTNSFKSDSWSVKPLIIR